MGLLNGEVRQPASGPQIGLGPLPQDIAKVGHAVLEGESSRSRAPEELDATTHLLFFACQGDVDELNGLIKDGTNVNGADYDGRTALHLAASEGRVEVVQLLLSAGAAINPTDRFGSTPLADALHYGYAEVARILKAAGGMVTNESGYLTSPQDSPLKNAEYEIEVSELDFSKAEHVGKGAFGEIRAVTWRGTRVAVKSILEDMSKDDPRREAEFRAELAILQKLRHPNIVQFLGAVTQTEPHMLVTEYLTRGSLDDILERKGPLSAKEAVRYALDIARGMSYLHQHKPDPIVHRDLKPRNLLRDEAGHLKVADFGLSRLLKATTTEKLHELHDMSGEPSTYRYMAPEVYLGESYDKSVDVFPFAMIVYEMFEGARILTDDEDKKVAEKFAKEKFRPPFTASTYPPAMAELIQACWAKEAKKRPNFIDIVERLETIESSLTQEARRTPSSEAVRKQRKKEHNFGCNCLIS